MKERDCVAQVQTTDAIWYRARMRQTGNVVMLTWRDGAGQQKGEYVKAQDVVSVRRFRE